MIEAIVIFVMAFSYGFCTAITARLAAGHIAYMLNDGYRGKPTIGDWIIGSMLGIIIGFFWPLVVIVRSINLNKYAVGEEAKAIRKMREEYIRKLEKDTGITGDDAPFVEKWSQVVTRLGGNKPRFR